MNHKVIHTYANKKQFPCPLCRDTIYVIGVSNSGKKIGSCGCVWKFKKSRSEKELDRKYVRTLDGGLELKKEV